MRDNQVLSEESAKLKRDLKALHEKIGLIYPLFEILNVSPGVDKHDFSSESIITLVNQVKKAAAQHRTPDIRIQRSDNSVLHTSCNTPRKTRDYRQSILPELASFLKKGKTDARATQRLSVGLLSRH